MKVLKEPFVLRMAKDSTPDEPIVYGLGSIVQLAQKEAGIFAARRLNGRGHIDYEAGTDLFIVKDLKTPPNTEDAITISQNHDEIYTREDGENIRVNMVKYPIAGGFVPVGAKLADGSNHPYAGTGFGLCHAMAFEIESGGTEELPDLTERQRQLEIERRRAKFEGRWPFHQYFELQQYTYDGSQFSITETRRTKFDEFIPGHTFDGRKSLRFGIPDGKDLLFGMRIGELHDAGVTRWRYENGAWKPIDFVNVTVEGKGRPKSSYDNLSIEPSVIRDSEGELLFTTRQLQEHRYKFRVWRSVDGGNTWKETINIPNAREQATVTLNQTVDGTPYLAANIFNASETFPDGTPRPSGPSDQRSVYTREKLAIWPINKTCDGLEDPVLVCDGWSEFSEPGKTTDWWADHPVGLTVRLEDGWHHVLGFRVVSYAEVRGLSRPLPQTGYYLREIVTDGPVFKPWLFEDDTA